ncbi:MAG: TRAP transporter small permease [Gammaproteobacteria bacterium]|nr:TRAP transporter small permease [Gammaproteobacteria bacterium]
MRRLLNGLYLLSGGLAAFFILAICAVVMAQVMLNLADRIASFTFGEAIGLTIPSYADFTGFFLAASSFLALAYTLRSGGHIRVTLLITMLSGRTQRLFEIWSVGLVMIITIFIAWYAISLTHESFVYGDLSSGMVAVPLWIPQSFVAFGLVVLAIALVDEFICLLSGKAASYADKGEGLLAGGEKE